MGDCYRGGAGRGGSVIGKVGLASVMVYLPITIFLARRLRRPGGGSTRRFRPAFSIGQPGWAVSGTNRSNRSVHIKHAAHADEADNWVHPRPASTTVPPIAFRDSGLRCKFACVRFRSARGPAIRPMPRIALRGFVWLSSLNTPYSGVKAKCQQMRRGEYA
jgi:hypothetical protein